MRRTLKVIALVLVVLAVSGFAWLWFAPCGLGGCAPTSQLHEFQAEGSELFDVNGDALGMLATVNRRVVMLDSLPEYLPQAFLAVEDQRFYGHGGVDWRRFGGALVRNVRSGGVQEGGSTITMQLARNLFPEHLPYRERSIRRKAMEMRVARQIERSFSKDKILELYLNHIYLGQGAYGIDAAAQTYFGKPAAEVTLEEAALLGGLPQSPSRSNPVDGPEAALRRRNLVLEEMAKAGYVTREEADAARELPVRLAPRSARGEQTAAGYFVERVRRELEEEVGPRLYTAGLRVYTTLDPAVQTAAEEEVARQAAAVENGGFGAYRHATLAAAKAREDGEAPAYLQGAAVVMESETGAVRALVGGRDFDESEYDRIFQARRQPGSAFKPFVYLTALNRSMPPSRTLEDAPVRITLAGGRTWEPRNYTGTYAGTMTLREALTRSINTITVRLAQDVGMPAVIGTAQELGLTGDIPNTPATALGSAAVRPIEMAVAYAAFSNGGFRVNPHVIDRIEDRHGNVLYRAPRPRESAVDGASAFVLTSILRDVVDRGTGTPVRAAGFSGPAAGKTGTTNNSTDVWFVGYTPDLVGVVWFGLDQPATIVPGATGGRVAAPVWGRIMRRVYAQREMPAEWTPPRGVVTETVDRATGLVVDETCPARGDAYTEYFVRVRPPRQYCPDPQYPVLVTGSGWYDEELGTYVPDTLSRMDRGVDWPELEEMRRRGETTTAREPLPGSVSTEIPDTVRGASTVPRGAADPARTRTGTPAPPRETPPAAQPPRTRDDADAADDEPRLLGRPVEPPPAPTDTAGAGDDG
jgi:penicillin-binding protein 1A